jgi:hypothetical protein
MLSKIIITCLGFSLLLSSCKKEELSFVLEGNVGDASMGSPLANAKLSIYTFSAGSSIGVLAETINTNSQGDFSYELARDRYQKIEISVVKDNYFSFLDVIPFDELTTAESNTFTYNLSAKSWTRFVIVNQQPNESDEFKLLKNSGKEDCDECCPNSFSYYYGAIDTVVYCPNDANTTMKFYFWVNGNEANGVDSVFNTPFDTITKEFYY